MSGAMALTGVGRQGIALLSEIHKQYPGYHPLLKIVEIAFHKDADLKLQFECHKTVAKYVCPELKSVEVKTDPNDEPMVRVSLFDEDELSAAEDVEYREAQRIER